jgi:hypothetical protein
VIDDPRRPAASRTWLVAVGSAVAVVLVVTVVGLSVGSGRHRSAASSSGVFPSPSAFSSLQPSSSPGGASNQIPSPSPSTMTADAVATTAPLPTPTGPVPTAPAGGFYLCQGDPDMATCADGTGIPIHQLSVSMGGPYDTTYNAHDGNLYYRELLSNAHGGVERISRVALTGGVPQILVQGPDSVNETEVSFGSPFSSPDGNFLAYGQMTIANDVPGGPTQIPSPGAQTIGPPNRPPGMPISLRLVQIKIQNLRDLTVAPVIVPLSMVSSDIAAGPLLGWSADGKQLFLVGPGGKVDSLAIGTDGVATGVSTVFDPATLTPGCQVAQTLLSSSGDFFVVASCTNTIEVVKVHNGTPQPFGMLVNTKGWQVDTAELDTTGRVIALSWDAPPNSPQCVSVSGSARIVDGVPTAIQFETTPGCMFHGSGGGPAMVASAP